MGALPPIPQTTSEDPAGSSLNVVAGALGGATSASIAALDLLHCDVSLLRPSLFDVVHGDSPLNFLISPWRRFGLQTALLGNLATMSCVAVLHFAVVVGYHRYLHGELSVGILRSLLLEWYAPPWLDASAAVMFPALPVILMSILFPGTTLLSFGLLALKPTTTTNIVIGSLGFICACGVAWLVCCLLRRFVAPKARETKSRFHQAWSTPSKNTPSSRMLVVGWFLWFVAPRVSWEPKPLARASGPMLTQAVDGAAPRLFLQVMLLHGTVSALGGLASVSTSRVQCRTIAGLMGLLHFAAMMYYVYRRPFRSYVNRVLTPLQSAIVCILCAMKVAEAERLGWLQQLQAGCAIAEPVLNLLIYVVTKFWLSAAYSTETIDGNTEPTNQQKISPQEEADSPESHCESADLETDPNKGLSSTSASPIQVWVNHEPFGG